MRTETTHFCKMKVVILAAGYGTRLQRDVKHDPGQTYKHLLGVPKPLVPVGGECLISRWMATLTNTKGITSVYLVSNHHYAEQFYAWAKQWPEVQILDDGTNTNENRLGAIADINLCINKFHIKDDLLVIGGDTLFYKDFDLKSFLDEYHKRKLSEMGGALVTCYKCQDSETTKFGILELNKDKQVVGFLEKPDPKTTGSRWACPCFYLFSKEAAQLIFEFLTEKKDAPLKDKDATGHFIKYLQARRPVSVFILKSGRFDIGSLQSYIECDQYFSGASS